MSWSSWSEVGYGFQLWNGVNFKTVCNFLAANVKIDDVLLSDIIEDGEESDLEDLMNEPVSWTIARIINKREGTTIFKGYQYCGDTDQEEMLGAEPCFPWTMNEKDRTLTMEATHDILCGYAQQLGITIQPDYFEAMYCG